MAGKIKNFNHNLWYSESEGIITIGINEEGLQDVTEITSIDLPPEQDKVEADTSFGSVESDDGVIDIVSPVDGTIIEINTQVIDDPAVLMEDSYEEGWLVRIEAAGEIEDDEIEDEDDEDDDLDDEDDEELNEDED